MRRPPSRWQYCEPGHHLYKLLRLSGSISSQAPTPMRLCLSVSLSLPLPPPSSLSPLSLLSPPLSLSLSLSLSLLPLPLPLRYNFYSAYRKKEQSIGDFVTELKNLARNCDFGQTKAGAQLTAQLILEENLRDRLVCGVADSAIQRRLLGEADLDFKKALQMALAMESAAVNTAQLNAAAHDSTPCVNKVTARKYSTRKWEKKPPAQNRQKPCFRCGKTSHSADECRYKDAQCRYCHKDGHIMSNCFAKQKV